jgi:hypothetical protein
MKKLLAACLIATVGGVAAQAEGPPCEKPGCPAAPAPCPPPPPITWVEKTITMYRPELKSHDVKDTVDQLYLKPAPCTEKYLVPELVPIPQTKKVCIPKLVPHQIEREVCYTRTVAETVTDCNGCAKTVLKMVPAVKKVVQTVFDIEYVEQEVPVTTYDMKVEEKERAVAHLIGEIKPMDIIRRSYSLELVPYQVKVKVPVCAQVPPTCAKETLPAPRELEVPAVKPER